MTQQTTFLLRSLWEIAPWRDDVLATFERRVREGVSRREVQGELKAMIVGSLPEYAQLYPLNIDLAQVHWVLLTKFFCVCYYRKRRRRPIPDVPPYVVWLKLSEQWGPLSLHPQPDKAIKETVPVPHVPLEQKLLAIGGTRYVPAMHEPELKLLLARGEVFDEPAELVPGELNRCHANAARLWDGQRDALSIATGQALGDDGLWRQHSWVIRKHPAAGQARILETTIIPIKYFGVLLDDRESVGFGSERANINGDKTMKKLARFSPNPPA